MSSDQRKLRRPKTISKEDTLVKKQKNPKLLPVGDQ